MLIYYYNIKSFYQNYWLIITFIYILNLIITLTCGPKPTANKPFWDIDNDAAGVGDK